MVALVEVLADDQVKDLVLGRVDGQVLKDSLELLSGNMAGLGSIKVLEARLEQDSVRDDQSSHLSEGGYHDLHLFLCEIL